MAVPVIMFGPGLVLAWDEEKEEEKEGVDNQTHV
jgi:hypothetical protein